MLSASLQVLNSQHVCTCVNSHANFVPANNEGDLAAPGVDEAGPAGVRGDVLPVSCTETDGGVVKWLASILQDCSRTR